MRFLHYDIGESFCVDDIKLTERQLTQLATLRDLVQTELAKKGVNVKETLASFIADYEGIVNG